MLFISLYMLFSKGHQPKIDDKEIRRKEKRKTKGSNLENVRFFREKGIC